MSITHPQSTPQPPINNHAAEPSLFTEPASLSPALRGFVRCLQLQGYSDLEILALSRVLRVSGGSPASLSDPLFPIAVFAAVKHGHPVSLWYQGPDGEPLLAVQRQGENDSAVARLIKDVPARIAEVGTYVI